MSVDFHIMMAGDRAGTLEVAELSEFIEGKLYFMVLSNNKDSTTLQTFGDWKKSIDGDSVFYLNVDDSLVYDGFFSDFGPLNLAMIYRYIDTLRDTFKKYKRIIHCSHRTDQKKRANAAFLICAYMIIVEDWTAHQTYSILSQQYKYQYLPFRDASCMLSNEYSVKVEECVNALYKAKWYGFFNFSDFDLDEYETYETVEFGDINWIVPGTLLAFSSPHSRDYIDMSGYQIHSPAYYYQYFKDNNVKHVVRLNSKVTYDAKRTFVAVANIQHTDMVFTDGTPPSDLILQKFLRLCEQYIDDCPKVESTNVLNREPSIATNENGEASANQNVGAVAVHCKAGLGRTGCLVASYIVKHWSFTAVEAIAWIRICRPGSVIGVQQQWLINKEEYLKTDGKQWREKRNNSVDKYRRFKNGVYSVKRHTSNMNEYEYVDPPPQSNISSEPSCDKSVNNQVSEVFVLTRLAASRLSKKMKNNNNVIPDAQTGLQAADLKQKRTKNEDSKLKNTLSTLKSCRRASNASVEFNMNNLVKKNIIPTSITITRSNSKSSLTSKKNTKSLNKTTRLTRSTPSETEKKIADTSEPSYRLATVASSARASRRLRSQNTNNK